MRTTDVFMHNFPPEEKERGKNSSDIRIDSARDLPFFPHIERGGPLVGMAVPPPPFTGIDTHSHCRCHVRDKGRSGLASSTTEANTEREHKDRGLIDIHSGGNEDEGRGNVFYAGLADSGRKEGRN